MKQILITGGSGFIGSNLCEKLLELNNKIICVDSLITGSLSNINNLLHNKNFQFINIDITDSNQMKILNEYHIDEIYHLASIASPEKYKAYSLETLNVNVIGTINVLNLCLYHNAKLVFTSTSEVYGDPLIHPQIEEYFGNVNILGERSCYDEGKRVAETYLYEYKKRYNLDVKIVRLFNTYGPKLNIHDGRIITELMKAIIKDEPLKIYGSGNQTRSFCYIDDTLNGIVNMMNSTEFGPINIGNPDFEITINELVSIMSKIINKPIKVIYLSKTEDDPKVRKPNIDRALNLISWKPVVDLKDGLERTLFYFQNNIDTIK
jgi:UDP-glucuronate decarboxylase